MPRGNRYKVFAGLGALAVLCILLYAPKLHSQLTGAVLSGVITDQSGAAIPNAQIQIKNLATGIVRTVQSDSAGFYTAPNLPPGSYDVTVSATGFKTIARTGIALTVGAQQRLNVPLQVGAVTQKVTVSGAPPAVQLTTPTLSGYVGAATVRQLPLNGRDWTQLATLQPGVIAGRAQASTASTANRGNRGFGNQLADAGHRPNENTYQIDGIVINDYSNGAPGSVEGVNLGVDAIQEFSVLTSNYSAAAGRTSGAVINAVTRAGTNQFHGDAYYFFRDKVFDARNFFAGVKPPFRRGQFGASGGGPIQRNKTFIFGDYEAIRQSLGVSFHDFTLSDAARNGQLCSTPNGTCQPTTVTVDPKVAPFLGLWPKSSTPVPGGNGDTAVLNTSGQQTINENYFTTRLDHTFSSSDNVSGTYFFDTAPQTNPDPLGNYNSSVFTRRQMVGITENHIFSPQLMNTFRLGFSRVVGLVNRPGTAFNPLANSTSLSAIPGKFAPLLSVPGLTGASGLGALSIFFHHWNSYQVYDDAFLTHGTQTIAFGFDFERMQYNCLSAVRQNGNFVFGSLANFLTNQPTSVLLLNPNISQEVGSRQSRIGVYIQDNWRLTPNFTWDMGLRWEPTTLPTEAHGGFAVLSNFYTGTIPGSEHVNTLWASNASLHDFDPRIGFAWDPFHTGKTSVRGAFGIFDVLPLPYVYTIGTSLTYPFAVSSSASNLPPGSFPTGALAFIGTSTTSYGARFIEQKPHRPYTMNWNLNVQRELFPSWTATIGYVGSHTVHEDVTYDDANMVVPKSIGGRLFWPCDTSTTPCTAGEGTRANPNVGFIRPINWDGAASYEGLEGELRSTISHGFQFQASYTYGKCIDTGSGAQLGDPFLNSITSLIYFSKSARRGPCDFNISQNFVANYLWLVPSPKLASPFASRLVSGWEVGGIVTASTGVPFTLLMAGDPLGQNSSDPNDFPDRKAGCNPISGNVNGFLNLGCFSPPMAPAGASAICDPFPGLPGSCRNVFGNAGRNELVGPKLVDVDFSVLKDNFIPGISEAFNIQLRFEFFNLFNHPNFQAPVDNLYLFNGDGTSVGGAGAIDSTATDPREIQFGVKIIW